MANFGVYFQITNNLGSDLLFVFYDYMDHASWDNNNPKKIPSDGKPYQVHLDDPDRGAGAGGAVHYMAIVDGAPRFYRWYGDCPVWSTYNRAEGPGLLSYNNTGHPLTITIAIDKNTKGWTPVGLTQALTKEEQAAMVGKEPA